MRAAVLWKQQCQRQQALTVLEVGAHLDGQRVEGQRAQGHVHKNDADGDEGDVPVARKQAGRQLDSYQLTGWEGRCATRRAGGGMRSARHA